MPQRHRSIAIACLTAAALAAPAAAHASVPSKPPAPKMDRAMKRALSQSSRSAGKASRSFKTLLAGGRVDADANCAYTGQGSDQGTNIQFLGNTPRVASQNGGNQNVAVAWGLQRSDGSTVWDDWNTGIVRRDGSWVTQLGGSLYYPYIAWDTGTNTPTQRVALDWPVTRDGWGWRPMLAVTWWSGTAWSATEVVFVPLGGAYRYCF
jgi:hypothetical protein